MLLRSGEKPIEPCMIQRQSGNRLQLNRFGQMAGCLRRHSDMTIDCGQHQLGNEIGGKQGQALSEAVPPRIKIAAAGVRYPAPHMRNVMEVRFGLHHQEIVEVNDGFRFLAEQQRIDPGGIVTQSMPAAQANGFERPRLPVRRPADVGAGAGNR